MFSLPPLKKLKVCMLQRMWLLHPTNVSLVGAIELLDVGHMLAIAKF